MTHSFYFVVSTTWLSSENRWWILSLKTNLTRRVLVILTRRYSLRRHSHFNLFPHKFLSCLLQRLCMVDHLLKLDVGISFHTPPRYFSPRCGVFVHVEWLFSAFLIMPILIPRLDKVHKNIDIGEAGDLEVGLRVWSLLAAVGSDLNKLGRLHWLINYNNEQNQHFGVHAQSALDLEFILARDPHTESNDQTGREGLARAQTTQKWRSTRKHTMPYVRKEKYYWDSEANITSIMGILHSSVQCRMRRRVLSGPFLRGQLLGHDSFLR
jgi:hypothetical protein